MSEERYAIVLGRNYTSRLGMIRAAGQAGYPVAVVKTDKHKETDRKKDKIDASSKYVKNYYCFPEPADEEIISFLLKEFCNFELPPVLLPTDDYTASFIDRHIDMLRGKFLYPSIRDKQGEVVRYMDKGVQKELAREAGLNVVEAWTAYWNGKAYDIPDSVAYPCFLKPKVSVQGSKLIMQKCSSREELEDALNRITKNYGPLLLEQFVKIEKEYDIPGLSVNGTVVIPGIIQKGLIHLGVTGTGQMMDISAFGDLSDIITAFIRSIEVDGLIDIELYQYEGKIYFNELNLRFGASGFSMMSSGINMPAMLIDYLVSHQLSINGRFVPNKKFASEKVCCQKYSAGRISWQEYKKIIADADFLFVENQDDPKPGRYLKQSIVMMRIKKYVKSFVKKKLGM